MLQIDEYDEGLSPCDGDQPFDSEFSITGASGK